MSTFVIERSIPGASELTSDQLRDIAIKSNAVVDGVKSYVVSRREIPVPPFTTTTRCSGRSVAVRSPGAGTTRCSTAPSRAPDAGCPGSTSSTGRRSW